MNPFNLVQGTSANLVLPIKTPVNAIAATGSVTFVGGVPNVHVDNVDATGAITITGTPIEDEHLIVGAIEFHFKAAPSGPGEILIDVDNTIQAANIVDAITSDLVTVTATNLLGVVALTSVAPGVAGNALLLTTNATGVSVSGSGILEGGIDHLHETVVIGSQEFVFVTARTIPGDVTVGVDEDTTAHNLTAAINLDTPAVSAGHVAGVVTITAVVRGAAGNAITLSESATNTTISAGGSLAGGVDGTIGAVNEICADSNFLYHCPTANAIYGANWLRTSLGASY